MCLSTAYYNSKDEENIAARYVSEIRSEGDTVVLTDVMGAELAIDGTVVYVDLTGGTVIVRTRD